MYTTLLPLMQCTVCGRELSVSSIRQASASGEIVEGEVTCATGHVWPIENSILVFTREDAPSDPWSKS
ncbi:MAG: hypothetical protein M1546_27165 [Chloroflexi bacterium]|nr:hypothetical protein [Chloroflexota bacterium]